MDKLRKKKKVKPRFVPMNENGQDIEEALSSSIESNRAISGQNSRQLISPNEYQDYGSNTRTRTDRQDPNPTALPSEEVNIPIGFQNEAIKRRFLQKVYAVLMAQNTLFAGLTFLFVKIPHLREIIRTIFVDELLLTSFIGYPLIIFIGLFMFFPKYFRKYAWIAITILTVCLSLLISYAVSYQSAEPFLYSFISSDLCCALVIGASFLKKIDFTSWKLLPFIPVFMTTASCLSPVILGTKVSNTLLPSIASSLLMTYLSLNTRPVVRLNHLKIEPSEYLFAATQLYLQPTHYIKHRLKSYCLGEARERHAYEQI